MNILVINCDSSSLTYQLRDMADERILAQGAAEGIGEESGAPGRLAHEANGKPSFEADIVIPDHRSALAACTWKLADPEHGVLGDLSEIDAVGHRVLYGGEHFPGSVLITEEVLDRVRRCVELPPLHELPDLAGIEAALRLLPDCLHVAVFDTAFHATLPPPACQHALPKEYYERFGLQGYGSHGIVHRFLSQEAARLLGPSEHDEGHRIVTVHPGNGCSIGAVRGTQHVGSAMPLDTELDTVTDPLNRRSGPLEFGGTGNGMRAPPQLDDDNASLAMDVFCHRLRTCIGACAAAMGGLNAIAFAAGGGENAPAVRRQVCDGLGFLGARIDPTLNEQGHGARDISARDATCRLLVIPADEELLIARETKEVLRSRASPRQPRLRSSENES
jgi:acetate kinase